MAIRGFDRCGLPTSYLNARLGSCSNLKEVVGLRGGSIGIRRARMGGEVLVVGIFFGILCDKEKLVTVWSDVAW